MNPYLIPGPALISFSGGRTSGYMLWHILEAHGGALPDDVHVCFANTGKEREETLRFVHECEVRWGVRVRWLERSYGRHTADRFSEVGYNSASRNGEPFTETIRRHQYLPNHAMPYCSEDLKLRPMANFMRAQGYKRWTNAIGLRADEMQRVFKQIAFNERGKQRFETVMPMTTLAAGRVRKSDVDQFWRKQPFDLGIHSADGNCDLCWKKRRSNKMALLRENPQTGDWWADEERKAKCVVGTGMARWDAAENVTQLRAVALASPTLPLDGDDEFDAECGLWCAGEAS